MINWDEIQHSLYPLPNYEDLSKRCRDSFTYAFVRRCYNFTMPQLAEYTSHLLGEDSRGRYTAWLEKLTRTFQQLQAAQVGSVHELIEQTATREMFAGFAARTGINPLDLASVLKYQLYWFIPMKKPIRSLVKNDPRLFAAIDQLRQVGMRSNLDLIENGITPQARRALAASAVVPPDAVDELVNRSDFSRMPWASAATVANIIGAGYASLAKLSAADPQRLSADFYRYGESIGKNLKHGNEIESSHRIAKLIPPVLVE